MLINAHSSGETFQEGRGRQEPSIAEFRRAMDLDEILI